MIMDSIDIPGSYQSYLETFSQQPELALKRLENRVEKRNSGAVGYFLLSWLYFKHGDTEKALENAIQAKVRAPGSQLMGRMHYFISHPDQFDAWTPERTPAVRANDHHSESSALHIQDLDQLIHKLSSAKINRMQLDESQRDQPSPDLSEKSTDVADIVTETLAVIHEKQKNYTAAIETYKKLQKINPDREEYFAKKIERLQKKAQEGK